MKLLLDCPCGEQLVGTSDDDVVDTAQRHLAASHPGMEYSREEILFMTRGRG